MIAAGRVRQNLCRWPASPANVDVIEAGIWIPAFAGDRDAVLQRDAFKGPEEPRLFDLRQGGV